jgi:gluconate 2-dehydrogenase gamma chain
MAPKNPVNSVSPVNPVNDAPRIISRRDLLKSVAIAGAAAAVPATGVPADAAAALGAQAAAAPAAAGRDALESLTSAESDTLEALAARLIPTDANGPGAKEARAARYIDRALGGALSGSREAYRSGLAALDAYARSSKGGGFHELAASDQDAVLTDVERGSASGFASSTQFFNMVRTHTIQGTFGDPYYGGNADFVGWDLIAYPGVRTQVTPADQTALEHDQLKPNHRSAYDSQMFTKATVRLDLHDEAAHGD